LIVGVVESTRLNSELRVEDVALAGPLYENVRPKHEVCSPAAAVQDVPHPRNMPICGYFP
jgi:hypothetical protein